MYDSLGHTVNYVVSDPYFWPAMAFTTIVGMFIGSVIYNGDVRGAKKAMVAVISYALLLLLTNIARISRVIFIDPAHMYQPYASVLTIIIISVFYIIGMFIGIYITQHAHKEVKS